VNAIHERHCGTIQLESSARQWRTTSPTVNLARIKPRVDQALNSDTKENSGKPATSSTMERHPGSPAWIMVVPTDLLHRATCQGFPNSNFWKQGRISGVLATNDRMFQKGRHTSNMGLNSLSTKPVTDYQPTLGLINMFSKTGTQHLKPKHKPQIVTPPYQSPSHRRSHVKVLRSRMEGHGVPPHGNGAGNGYRGNGNGSF
jgi:hypothetical protein